MPSPSDTIIKEEQPSKSGAVIDAAFSPSLSAGIASRPNLRFRLSKLAVQTVGVVLLTLIGLEALTRLLAVVGQWEPQRSDEYQCKLALAGTPSTNYTIFFLGSSFTSKTIYADYLSRKLQQNGIRAEAINLAMLASKPHVQLDLLDKALKAGRKPIVAFYDVSPISGYIAAKEDHRLQPNPFIPYLLVYRDRLAAIYHTMPKILAAPSMVPPGGFGVKSIHMSAAGWEPSLDVAQQSWIRGTVAKRKGIVAANADRPEFFKYLAEVKEYCLQKDVPLVFVWYPTSSDVDGLYETLGMSNQAFSGMFKEKAKEWHVGFLDLHKPIDPAFLHDCDHINAAGAVAITNEMARIISAPGFNKTSAAN